MRVLSCSYLCFIIICEFAIVPFTTNQFVGITDGSRRMLPVLVKRFSGEARMKEMNSDSRFTRAPIRLGKRHDGIPMVQRLILVSKNNVCWLKNFVIMRVYSCSYLCLIRSLRTCDCPFCEQSIYRCRRQKYRVSQPVVIFINGHNQPTKRFLGSHFIPFSR